MQENIIQSVLNGNDTLALLPTGGGKSICFQVPGMVKKGICIVVSPLISLMKDQVLSLRNKGIKSYALISGMKYNEIDTILDNCIYGDVKFLYVSPERLKTELVQERIKRMNVNLLAVDEAHCISQWGYDFRPPYLEIAEIRKLIPETPILALTATATDTVATDIMERLEFTKQKKFKQSFVRENISLSVFDVESKFNKCLEIVSKISGSGIIYANNRMKTKEVSQRLLQKGISSDYYHAGLSQESRENTQNKWLNNEIKVIVATNAFGMGIDKSDVRFVIHYNLPESPENYFQEAGRGGRDGKKGYAVLLIDNSDLSRLELSWKSKYPAHETLLRIYNALFNFYQLAIGSGEEQTYSFDIEKFSHTFNLKRVEVYYSMKYFEKIGIIHLSEAFHTSSRVKVLLAYENLYNFQIRNEKYAPILKFLLRNHSGIFDLYAKINEWQIANHFKTKEKDIIQSLAYLTKLKVVDYIPESNEPQLTFLIPRKKTYQLASQTNINSLKQNDKIRMESMILYATEKVECRSKVLLKYFGETKNDYCGICDNCLKRKANEASEVKSLQNKLIMILQDQPLTLSDLKVKLTDEYHEKLTDEIVNWMVLEERFEVDERGRIYVKSSS